MDCTIYDFLEGCIENGTEIYIYDLDKEENIFEGTIQDALLSDELEEIINEQVSSWEIGINTGKVGINFSME